MRVDRSISIKPVESLILTIRGQKVIMDSDLAGIYGVPTKALNQAVKRNRERFPADFMFQLAPQEVADLTSQSAISNPEGMRSQFVTASEKRNVRFRPYAFTEHGAIMAATVLNSPQAVRMSVFVVRAFVKMREQLSAQHAMEKRLTQIESALLVHDTALRELFHKIRPLLLPPAELPKREVGFRVKEKRTRYGMLKHRRK